LDKGFEFCVYITFTTHNIFINCYREFKTGVREAVGFKQLGGNKRLVGHSKKEREVILDMAEKTAAWVASWHNESVVVIFKNFGQDYRKKEQTDLGIEQARDIFMAAFDKANIFINAVVEASAIPYNGCKTHSARRRKNKHRDKVEPEWQEEELYVN